MADAIQMLPASTAALNDLRPTQFNWPVYLLGLGLAFVSVLQIMIQKKEKITFINRRLMKIRFLGHSCVEIVGKHHILIDPDFTLDPLPDVEYICVRMPTRTI